MMALTGRAVGIVKRRWPVLAAVALFLLTWLLPVQYEAGGRNYLLSTISQALAAVFALAFSISFVAAQIAGRYSPHVVAGFFNPEVITHALLFVAATVCPWLLLSCSYAPRVLDSAAVGLGAYCSLWLVSFFINMKDMVSIRKRFHRLCSRLREIGVSVTPESRDEAKPIVNEIEDVMSSALAKKDFTTFRMGLHELLDLSLHPGQVKGPFWLPLECLYRSWAHEGAADNRAGVVFAEVLASSLQKEVGRGNEFDVLQLRVVLPEVGDAVNDLFQYRSLGLRSTDERLMKSVVDAHSKLALVAAVSLDESLFSSAVSSMQAASSAWASATKSGRFLEVPDGILDALEALAKSKKHNNADLQKQSAMKQRIAQAVWDACLALAEGQPRTPARRLLLDLPLSRFRAHDAGLYESSFAAVLGRCPEERKSMLQEIYAAGLPDSVADQRAHPESH
jgi:hypothetical protein